MQEVEEASQQSSSCQAHETKPKPHVDHASAVTGQEETPAEEKPGPLQVDEHPEIVSFGTSSQGQDNEALGTEVANTTNASNQTEQKTSSSTTEDQTVRVDTEAGATRPLPVQKPSNTNEGQRGANNVSDATKTTSSTSNEISTEEVRGPAVLEESGPSNTPNPSEIHQRDKDVNDKAPNKPLGDGPTIPSDQQGQKDDNSATEERNVSKSGQGSSSADSSAVNTPNSATDTGSAAKQPQQKGSVSNKEESGTFSQVSNSRR